MYKKLIGRNLKIYFRDRAAVFFSLLSVLIVIALYILFLAEMQIDAVNNATNNVIPRDDISYLINSWILAGLLSVTTVTSTLGAYGTMVNDKERKIIMDFKSAPLSGMVYPVVSIITAFIVGSIISIISFIAYSSYIYIGCGYYFSIGQNIQCLALIGLSALMSASLMGFMVSFFKGSGAFSAASVIIGTVIGFLNGLYVPIGALPETVRNVIRILPFGHIASLFRQVLMSESIELAFKGAPKEVTNGYISEFGIKLDWGSNTIDPRVSLLFIILVCLISLLLFFINYSRKDRDI